MSEASNVSRTPVVSNLAPELGWRFAGFVDGEGHFAIARHRKRRTGTVNYACSFVLHVRDDDRAVIETFQEALGGLGVLYDLGERVKPGMHTRPTVMWAISNKPDCLPIVDVFETYPLWTRKARDFAIWAQAVRYWNGPKPEGWAPMARWFDEIREVRQYDFTVTETQVVEASALSLFDEVLSGTQ